MIYTVTFNPSLDYVIQVDDLTLGEVNRTTSEKIYPGGKGNNVSVILSNLGHKSKALGFKAGLPESRWKPCWKNSDAIRILSRWKKG